MSDRPLVSVVIIFWNAEQFIRESIESVFAQTYDVWELILVDDGSSDESVEVAQDWARRHPERVRYVEHVGHANRGMSASRNLGIRHARGALIAFLDADDVWFRSTLDEQVAILEAHPQAAMVYGPIQYWQSWSGRPGDAGSDRVEGLGVRPDTLIRPPWLLPRFLRDKAAVPSGLLVRRQIIEEIGGFEEQFRGEYEDQVFCAKICLKAPVFAAGQCWYRYRQHPDSCVMTGQRTGTTHAARLRFLEWLAAHLVAQQVRDRAVWRAVELELWQYRRPRAFRLLQRGERLVTRLQHFLGKHRAGPWRSPRP